MLNPFKTWFFVWLIFGCFLQACVKEDVEQRAIDAESSASQTNICAADSDGGRGDIVFSGLVTYDECEALCAPIYEELIADNGTGYCQFGAERIWEYPYYDN